MSKNLKQKLQSVNFQKQNLQNHLTEVLKKLLLDDPSHAYQLFEQYSLRIKNKSFDQVSNSFIHDNYNNLKEYIQKTKLLINKPNVGTEQQPAEPGPTGYVPNILLQSRWFEHVGIGFGQELTYKIFKSLERFSITKQIKQLKFWGKIICQHNDYYIVEGISEGGEEVGELPPDVQAKGQGVNKLTYWVCTDLNNDWIQLPVVTPQQMRVSRKIKYFFTGNLENAVITNPHFIGKQKHLLKCQIVRITTSCNLVPRTMYNVNQQDKKQIDLAEDWKFPTFEFLSSQENWVHLPQNILKNGRLTHLKPEIPEGQQIDEQKLMKQIQSKDPFQERLKPISKDTYLKIPAWKLSVLGDNCSYRANTKAIQNINYGFICLRSNIWKGYTIIYHNKQWTSIYVGYGYKTSDKIYFPCQPESILSESKQTQEQPEPNYPLQQPKKEGQNNEVNIQSS